jgi:hypothetical protein
MKHHCSHECSHEPKDPAHSAAGSYGSAQAPADPARRTAVRNSLWALLAGIGAATVGALSPKSAQASGYGGCCKCECRGFEGSTYQCSNCGHQYADHGCMK